MTRRPLAIGLGLVLLALAPRAQGNDEGGVAAKASLWGASEGGETPYARYQKTCEQTRRLLDNPRDRSPESLRGAAALLRAAVRDYPEGGEGWALLGQALVELGPATAAEARAALRRAQSLGEGGSRLLLALAHSTAQQGDLGGALEIYQRLAGQGLVTPLLHRRTGDVLMALGRLHEAIERYRLACPARRPASADLELARGCYALAVALDRAEQLRESRAILRGALAYDRAGRSLEGEDFVPPAERAYYLSLREEAWRRDPCAARAHLDAYLAAPSLYAARARERQALLVQRCKAGYSDLWNRL
jgi:tetratricopeptide (TPR) repeat protein